MYSNSVDVQLKKTLFSTKSIVDFLKQRLRAVFWLVAIVLGFVQAWAHRHTMNPDGVSCLDVGEAYLRGNGTQQSMLIGAHCIPGSWAL